MHLEPGETFEAEAGAAEIAEKHINRQSVVLLVAVADCATVMWKYSLTVGAAPAMVAVNTYLLAFAVAPAHILSTYPFLYLV